MEGKWAFWIALLLFIAGYTFKTEIRCHLGNEYACAEISISDAIRALGENDD
jgi:hypothetical protein